MRASAARRDASALLRAAGVASPERDADLLLAHVLDVGLGRLPLVVGVILTVRVLPLIAWIGAGAALMPFPVLALSFPVAALGGVIRVRPILAIPGPM